MREGQGRGEGGQEGSKTWGPWHKGPMNNNSVFQIWLKLRGLCQVHDQKGPQ